ncbi:MAG TPA: hypothetical protein PK006_08000 [Saprospiraceae bacterium]|nr:hypothetical protein [Saprospiraceae bacterium]
MNLIRKFQQLFIVVILACFISCKSDNKLQDPKLQELQNAFNKNPNQESYDKLITSYLELMQKHSKDKPMIEEALASCFAASEKIGAKTQQVIFLNNLMKDYPDRPDHKENVVKMIGLLDSLNRTGPADVMSLCYLKAYPNDEKAAQLKAGIPEKYTLPDSCILDIGRAIFSDTTQKFSEEKARVYVDACEAYALAIPKDEAAPEFIFKAAETSNALKTYEKSFALYDWIIDAYPKHPRAPMALFMKGFLFDGTIKDSANARRFYTEFLEKYPKHEFVKDAKVLLSNIGKSDEQVLQELMEKNKNNNK